MPTPQVSRRAFLRAGATAAAAMSYGTRSTVLAAHSAWSMKQACSSIAFASLPIEEAVARIARLGFDAIDIWSAHAGCPHLDDCLDRLRADGLKDLLSQHAMKLYAFSVYRGGFSKYAELLGQMGGGVAVRGSGTFTDPDDLQGSMKKFLESLKPEIELAEKYNCYLAIENHSGKPILNYLDSIKAFADLNDHPRVGIALAPYHIQKNGESVEEAIRACGDQLLFFYAWQNAEDTGQLPGVGPTDLRPWLECLAEIDFRHPVTPFMHHEPEPDVMQGLLGRSQQYLRDCHAQVTVRQ